MLLAGCTSPREWPAGAALVANITDASWSWGTAEGLEPFVEAKALDPTCAGCIAFQGRVRTADDGADEVVLTWSEHDGGEDDLRSRVGGVDRQTGELRWTMDALDLTGVSGACDPEPTDPCEPAYPSGAERDVCQMKMVHDVAVVEETDEGLRMWLADASNGRVLEVWLPEGETCGEVRTVLDQSAPDWDVYNSPNRVHGFEDAGGEHLWVSAKGGLPSTEAGLAQGADLSSGKLLGWTKRSEGWRQDWEFPPESTTAPSFLNTPHGLAPPGAPANMLVYAHTLSDSWDWGEGTGGSIGVATLAEGVPTYAYDAQLDSRYLHFPRAVSPLGDGTWLVLDSGCFDSAGCEFPSQAWRVSLPEITSSGLSGAWDRDGSTISWAEATVIDGPLWTTDDTLYAVDWVPG